MPHPLRCRAAWWTLGVLLALLAFVMPTGWYDALPRNPEVPAPALRGVDLLRWVLLFEAALCAWAGLRRARVPLAQPAPELVPSPTAEPGSERRSAIALAVITVVAFAVRLYDLDSDLWLDEVRATLDAREMSVLQVIGSYTRSNVHILNTLLMKLSIAVCGESAWAARLPAATFGALTVPALYWVARLAAGRTASLACAAILAVSYHHVFFSQNARGYAPYLLFSLLATGLLVRGLIADRPRTWLLYVVCTWLNFVSLLMSGFVFAAHMVVGAVYVVALWRRGGAVGPLLRRLAGVFGIVTLLGFQAYALVIPQVLAYVKTTYGDPSSGYWLLSTEFVQEMVRGLTAGFGPVLLLGVLPFLALAGAGFVALWRRRWTLALALALPIALSAILLVVRGLTVSPRFFLLGLPVAILTAMAAVDSVGAWWDGRRVRHGRPRVRRALVIGVAALLCGISIRSLGPYYATPKQSFRATLQHLRAIRRPGEIVIAVHAAGRGIQYYAPAFGLREGHELFLAANGDEMALLVASLGADGAYLVTTFPRALRLVHPELAARIDEQWQVDKVFPATIGDGQLTVWTRRPGSAP